MNKWLKKARELPIRTKVILIYLSVALFYAIGLGILLKTQFEMLPFYIQFFIGSTPIYLLFSIILGGIKDWKRVVSGFILFFTSDAIIFPFLVTLNEINTLGIVGAQASSDVFLATILQTFGLSGFWLYVSTYVIATTFLVAVAVYLVSPLELKKEFN